MSHRKKIIILGIVLTITGAAGMAPTVYYWAKNRVAANSAQMIIPASQPEPGPTLITGKPIELRIDSLQFKLQVVDGTYNPKTGQWALSKDKAHFALPSVQPNNQEGNSLIYGHYRPEVFARLHKIKAGAEAVIMTENGYVFIYKYRSNQAVDPADTSIFAYRGAPMLTLQTCSGAWMQNRQLYSFDLVGVTKVAN